MGSHQDQIQVFITALVRGTDWKLAWNTCFFNVREKWSTQGSTPPLETHIRCPLGKMTRILLTVSYFHRNLNHDLGLMLTGKHDVLAVTYPFLFARGLVMRMCILKLYPLDSLIHPFPVTGCTINGTYPSYHRAEVGNKWTSPSHTHTPMPTGDLELPVHLQHAYLRTEGGSQSTRREPTHAQGEHVKLHTGKPRVKIDPGTFLL